MDTSPNGDRRAPTSELYELWTLSVILRIGCTAAEVFESNPKQFKQVPSNISDLLAKLHYRTGYDETYLDYSQQVRLVAPLLGESDGTNHSDQSSDFQKAAIGLRQAAVDYVQRSFDTGERQLRNAFRDAAKTMYAHLTKIEGIVSTSALVRLDTHFGDVVRILQSVEYCGGLGLPPAPSYPWPRFGRVNGDGAALIEELTRRAGLYLPTDIELIGATEFTYVQRIADNGAASLDEVFRDPAMEDDDKVNEVIDIVYRWWTALRDLRSAL